MNKTPKTEKDVQGRPLSPLASAVIKEMRANIDAQSKKEKSK